MKRYILTGAPGAGKTAILRYLETDGHTVIEEAATDIIALEQARGCAEPWTTASFPKRICQLQRQRQVNASSRADTLQFYDRSPICTYALAQYLSHPVPPDLENELARIETEHIYQRQVFFIQLLGFITPTPARRIDLTEAMRFEQIHLNIYRELGYDCTQIPPGHLSDRAETIKKITRQP